MIGIYAKRKKKMTNIVCYNFVRVLTATGIYVGDSLRDNNISLIFDITTGVVASLATSNFHSMCKVVVHSCTWRMFFKQVLPTNNILSLSENQGIGLPELAFSLSLLRTIFITACVAVCKFGFHLYIK